MKLLILTIKRLQTFLKHYQNLRNGDKAIQFTPNNNSASEITYIVSGGALNSTHLSIYLPNNRYLPLNGLLTDRLKIFTLLIFYRACSKFPELVAKYC